jgi:fumarylacetoacetase
MIDATHDASRRCWVPGADGHADFPIQNLPFGVFSPPGGSPRGGVAIGPAILDLAACLAAGLFSGEAEMAAKAAARPLLNDFLALGAGPRRALRARLSALLEAASPEAARMTPMLHPAATCTMHLPVRVGGFTDFYAGIHHAMNAGRQFRPDNPLLPNYKWVPIAYHGRASSIVPSGTAVRRPNGQRNSQPGAPPAFGPSRRMDYELELGAWIGPGNTLGTPIPMHQAGAHVAGFCLLNDWSARDVQAWEYQPLGPFLAKNFASTVSPWIVTAEAMAPFRMPVPPRPAGDPAPLPYLSDPADAVAGGIDLTLQVALSTARMRAAGLAPQKLTASNARDLYWTVAQMVAHHTANGCNLQPGDLLGSGTITSPGEAGFGSLLELTEGGKRPLSLPGGETRTFLEDEDEVVFTARAAREGFATIGFGPCIGRVLPALDLPGA